MKMNSHWLAIVLLLATISAPASLLATTGGPDGNPEGPPPVVHPSPMPTDGNPEGPPPGVVLQLAGR